MFRKLKYIIIASLFLPLSAFAFPTSGVYQGGTGSSSPSGILYGDNGATQSLKTLIIGSGLSFSGSILSSLVSSATFGTTSISATYPLSWNTSTARLSTVATSSLNLTVSSFLSSNISQWTNDSLFVTSSFSTTSANYWDGTVFRWATTSSNYAFAVSLAGTTTDALPQGSTNKYYSTSLFSTSLAGTTTTALNEGVNLYWTNTRFDNRLSASSSISGITTLPNLSLPSSQISGTITAASSTLLSDRNSFSGTDTFSSRLGVGTTSPVGDFVVRGHIQTGVAAVPILTTCGTSPTINGSDHAGRIIIGGGVISSCIMTFNKAWTNAPICNADDESAILLTRIVATTSGMTLSVATTFQGDSVGYSCQAYE